MAERPGESPYVDYERVATRYGQGRSLPPDVIARWGEAVMPHVPDRPIVVADVGAGTGIFVTAWAQWATATVIAVEPSVAMLAARPPGARCVRAVAEHLPLPDGSVDVAWVSAALHHFADTGQAVAELARVVAPDGRILVRTHLPGRTAPGWLGAFPGHDRANERFPRLDGLAALFAPAGFSVAAVEEVLEGVHTHGASADWVERMRDADSILTALTDDEIAEGLAALRARPERDARIELSLVVLAREPAQPSAGAVAATTHPS